jgi:hypothetical protein
MNSGSTSHRPIGGTSVAETASALTELKSLQNDLIQWGSLLKSVKRGQKEQGADAGTGGRRSINAPVDGPLPMLGVGETHLAQIADQLLTAATTVQQLHRSLASSSDPRTAPNEASLATATNATRERADILQLQGTPQSRRVDSRGTEGMDRLPELESTPQFKQKIPQPPAKGGISASQPGSNGTQVRPGTSSAEVPNRPARLNYKPALPSFARPKTVSSGPGLDLEGGHLSGAPRGSGEIAAANEVAHVMPASLYLILESLVQAVKAESGSIWMPNGDEMISICNVGTKLAFPPSILRHMTSNALTGAVFASGIAIHQQHVGVNGGDSQPLKDDNHRRVRNLLMFPVFSSKGPHQQSKAAKDQATKGNRFGATSVSSTFEEGSDSEYEMNHSTGARVGAATPNTGGEGVGGNGPWISSNKGVPIAVIQIVNKRLGTAAFDAVDENLVQTSARLIAGILQRHDVNWFTNYYDPINLFSLEPFIPAPPLPSANSFSRPAALSDLGTEIAKLGTSTSKPSPHPTNNSPRNSPRNVALSPRLSASQTPNSKTMPMAPAGATPVRSALDLIPTEFVPPQLIHRSQIPISLAKRQLLQNDATPLGVAPSLLEVDSYLTNLQDCWRRAVQLNVQSQGAEAARLTQLKKTREELNKQRITTTSLEEELRRYKLDAGDYLREYVSLNDELKQFLEQVEQGGNSALATTPEA